MSAQIYTEYLFIPLAHDLLCNKLKWQQRSRFCTKTRIDGISPRNRTMQKLLIFFLEKKKHLKDDITCLLHLKTFTCIYWIRIMQ